MITVACTCTIRADVVQFKIGSAHTLRDAPYYISMIVLGLRVTFNVHLMGYQWALNKPSYKGSSALAMAPSPVEYRLDLGSTTIIGTGFSLIA